MPSLRILYDAEGWAYHHNARGLQQYAPPDFTVSLGPALDDSTADVALGETPVDLVLLFPNSRVGAVREALRRRGWPTRLVTAISSGWPVLASRFFRAYRLSDALVIANREFYERAGGLPRTHAAPYGVDPAVFRVRVPPGERRPRVLWTGALLHRDVKGYDDYVRPLERALRDRGIDTDFRAVDSRANAKRAPAEMAAWYNTGTVYVCASRAEGTPNPALEAAACGCTVVSTAVGNMPELIRNGVNGYLVPREVEALVDGVRAAVADYPRLAAGMQADIREWLWPRRAPSFYDAFRQVLAGEPGSAPRAVGPSEAAPLATVVARPAADAIGLAREALLESQDCACVRRSPAVRERRSADPGPGAGPPYCVWVDDDVLPYRHAVRTLVEELEAAGAGVAALVGTLFDVQLRRPVPGGLAVARREAIWPHARDVGSTASAIERLEAAGHVVRRLRPGAEPLGLCGTRWTPRAIYEQAARNEERRRADEAAADEVPGGVGAMVQRILEEKSELDLYALMGTISGALRRRRGPDPRGDLHGGEVAPGFHEVTGYLEALGRRPGPES
jgi:hypothetical protein